MRNKSRKRVLHEQRVRIAQLERQLEEKRAQSDLYDIVPIKMRSIMPPERDSYRRQKFLEMEREKTIRIMVEQIIERGAYDIIETREFSPRYGTVTGYEITIRLLRKKYRDVSYEQIEKATEKILVPKAVQNATQ